MKIFEILQEYINPTKPANVKKSEIRKAGVQGSIRKVKLYQFITSKNNNVKVFFEPTLDAYDNKIIDVSFMVNDATFQLTHEKDSEILPQVVYIIKNYLKKSKTNIFKFTAFSDNRDTKLKHNVPVENTIKKLLPIIENVLTLLYDVNITPEQQEKYLKQHNDLLKKLNKPPVNSISYIHKKELIELLNNAITFLNNLKPTENDAIQWQQIISNIQYYSKNVNNWQEYKNMIILATQLYEKLLSYTQYGYPMYSNRRANIYEKLLQKFANDWIIDKTGDIFILYRKEK